MFTTLLLSSQTFAATPSPSIEEGIEVHASTTVEHAPETMWRLLAEGFVSNAAQMVDGVEASRPAAADELPDGFEADVRAPVVGRVVTASSGGDRLHVLVDYDAEELQFTFRSASLPKVIAYAHNTHTLVPVDNGTEVSTLR